MRVGDQRFLTPSLSTLVHLQDQHWQMHLCDILPSALHQWTCLQGTWQSTKTGFLTGSWGSFLPTDPIAKYGTTAAAVLSYPFCVLPFRDPEPHGGGGPSLPKLHPSKAQFLCHVPGPLSPTDFLQSLTSSLRSCPGPTRKNNDGEESEATRQEQVLPCPFNHCSGLLWKFLCTFSHGCILPHTSPTPRILTSRLCRVPVGSWCQSEDQGRVV